MLSLPIDNMFRFSGSRRPSFPVSDQLDAHKQTSATHVADQSVLVFQRLAPSEEVVTHAERPLHKILFFYHV